MGRRESVKRPTKQTKNHLSKNNGIRFYLRDVRLSYFFNRCTCRQFLPLCLLSWFEASFCLCAHCIHYTSLHINKMLILLLICQLLYLIKHENPFICATLIFLFLIVPSVIAFRCCHFDKTNFFHMPCAP